MVYTIHRKRRRFVRLKRSLEHANPARVVGAGRQDVRHPRHWSEGRAHRGSSQTPQDEDRPPELTEPAQGCAQDSLEPRRGRGAREQQPQVPLPERSPRQHGAVGKAYPRPDDVVPRAPSAMTARPFEVWPFFFLYKKSYPSRGRTSNERKAFAIRQQQRRVAESATPPKVPLEIRGVFCSWDIVPDAAHEEGGPSFRTRYSKVYTS